MNNPLYFAGWNLLAATPRLSSILLMMLLPWRRPRGQNQGQGGRRIGNLLSRKHGVFSGYTFSIGMALQNIEKLIHHNVQPMIVQMVDEDQEEDDHADSNDPQVQFHRQLKKIRRGDPIDQLVLRVRRS
jgi:hypothetical protein